LSKEAAEHDRILATLAIVAVQDGSSEQPKDATAMGKADAAFKALAAVAPVPSQKGNLLSSVTRSGLSYLGASAQVAFGADSAVQSFSSMRNLLVAVSMAAS